MTVSCENLNYFVFFILTQPYTCEYLSHVNKTDKLNTQFDQWMCCLFKMIRANPNNGELVTDAPKLVGKPRKTTRRLRVKLNTTSLF